jgi:V-type H+-transporting ATPase subunit B
MSEQPKKPMTASETHVKAITRDYNIAPRVDYRTVLDVEGPLVILDNVKFPKYRLTLTSQIC